MTEPSSAIDHPTLTDDQATDHLRAIRRLVALVVAACEAAGIQITANIGVNQWSTDCTKQGLVLPFAPLPGPLWGPWGQITYHTKIDGDPGVIPAILEWLQGHGVMLEPFRPSADGTENYAVLRVEDIELPRPEFASHGEALAQAEYIQQSWQRTKDLI